MARSTVTASLTSLVAAASLVLTCQPASQAAPASTDHRAEATRAASYLTQHLSDLRATKAADLGPELDALIGVAAVNASDPAVDTMLKDVATYGPEYCPTANPTGHLGPCAKITIALMTAHKDPATFGGKNYEAAITSVTSYAKEYVTSDDLAIIALSRANKPIPAALFQATLDQAATQWPSKGDPAWLDIDSAGLTLTALSHVNDQRTSQPLTVIKGWVSRHRVANAGWTTASDPKDKHSDVNTTAWVAPGVQRTGDTGAATEGQSWLVSQQKSDGSLPTGPKLDELKNTLAATSQAIPPLLDLSSYDNAGSAYSPHTVQVTK